MWTSVSPCPARAAASQAQHRQRLHRPGPPSVEEIAGDVERGVRAALYLGGSLGAIGASLEEHLNDAGAVL